jgi:hypothetical protein
VTLIFTQTYSPSNDSDGNSTTTRAAINELLDAKVVSKININCKASLMVFGNKVQTFLDFYLNQKGKNIRED